MEEVLPEHTVDTPKFVKTEAVKNEHAAPNKLKKRPKKKKAMSKITPYPCEHCGKTLIGRGNLVAHIKRIHYRQKDHKCSICPKAFNTSSALESHMLAVHTRRCEACQEYVIESAPWPEGVDMKTKRKVACVCGESVEIYCHFGRRKMYDDDDEDQINRRRYNDQTKYACQHCGKLFTTRSHCLRHTKMHTGVRDVRCQYCPETFRYEASLKKHLKSEHKIFQNYFCKVCTQKFATGSKLEKHYREAHGQDSAVPEVATDVSEAHKNTMVKVIAKKDIPAASPKVLAVPTESRANLQSFTEACQKEAAGHSQSGMTIASLQTLPGTSHKGPQTEVSMTTVNEQSLDKATYEIVQQALQGDQMFSGGNTIIIRTVQVILDEDDEEGRIAVGFDTVGINQTKVEEMDDSDMEYLDLPEESEYNKRKFGDDEYNSPSQSDQDGSDCDPDYDPGVSLEEPATNSELVGSSVEPKKIGRPRSGQKSGNRKRKKKPLSECTPMQCEQCDTVLTGISSLKAHVKRMHLKQRDFKCHICLKEFFTTTHREDHIISVHTRRCDVCSRDVVESTPWTEGVNKTHLRIAKCPCGNDVRYISKVGRVKGYTDEEFADKPKKRKSVAESISMTCDECGQVCTGKSSLMAHIKRQHLKAFDHKCTICFKEFFTSTHLETHVLSLHTRKCKNCNAFVMEEEPWSKNMDRTQERVVTCKCGTPVSIYTKLGPKHRNGDGEAPPKKKSKSSTDTRYVCGTCGKIFLKKANAMSHMCVNKEAENSTPKSEQCTSREQIFATESEIKEHYKQSHESKYEVQPEIVEFKVEGDDFVLEEGSRVVMYESSEDQSDSAIASIQIMHDGKLVPAEQVVDEHGNVSFVLKTIQ